MKRLRLVVLLLLWASLSLAQTAVFKRNVNLRSDASTDSDIIEKLARGTQIQLVEPDETDRFYHITAPDGQDGWVWAKNIKVLAEGPNPTPAPTPNPNPTPTPSPRGDLFSQLMNARKPATGQPLIENGNEVCGPTGDAANPTAIALNNNEKRSLIAARTDMPGDSDYVDIGWSDWKPCPLIG